MGLVHHPNVVSDGLVYYADAGNRRSYPGAGTTLTDLVNGNNGTLENMDTGGFDSQKGGVIEFDGTNEYVEIGAYGASSVLNWGSGNGTVGVWMKSDDSTGTLIAMGAAGSGGKRYLIQYDNDGDKISFAMDNDVTLKAANGSDTSGLVDSKWHYVVGMRNGQYIYLYVDGVLDATTDLGAGYGSVDYTSNGGLYMGGIWHVGDTVGHFWNGYLALAHIYNRALSADEVSQNYEALKPRFAPRITTDGLFASWDAGDPESYVGGTTLKDTANHYDGTFVNNGSGGDISFDSANGGSLVFDGSDDYVNIITLPDCSSLARSAIIWVAVDDWPTSGSPVYTPFQSAADQFDISFGVTDSKIYFNGGGGTASTAQKWVTLSPVPADGAWICWAMTIDSSGDIVAMYRNAVALTASGTSAGFNIKQKTTIGCRIGTDGSSVENSLDGKVGSLRLYTKTLSAAEVMDNFQKTRGRFGV